MINSNTHSQVGTWKQGLRPVRGDCYHTIYLNCKTDFFFMFIVGAMAIAPYGFSLNQKHYNLTLLCQNGTAKLAKTRALPFVVTEEGVYI